MSDNTLICLVISAMIGGCATCSVSDDIHKTRKAQIESAERLEILKTAPKP